MNQLFLVLAIVFASSGAAFAQVSPQLNMERPSQREQFPATGKWKVVSQTSGPNVLAVPDNELYFSDGLLAEYDRINNPVTAVVSLYNVKWKGQGSAYSTPLYRSPSDTLQIEPFSDENIAAYCYLQIRAESAVLVISESKIDGDPFVSDGATAVLDANARMLTLFRVDNAPNSRFSHLKNYSDMITNTMGTNATLDAGLNKMIGGFLDEYKELASSHNK